MDDDLERRKAQVAAFEKSVRRIQEEHRDLILARREATNGNK